MSCFSASRTLDSIRRAATARCEKNEARRLLDLLTPREFEVKQLAIRGMLNKQIAGELGTAEKTVKVYRGRVMQKLGVTSVADLVRMSQRVGVPPARNPA
jgi:FixJ family two-component response regulator